MPAEKIRNRIILSKEMKVLYDKTDTGYFYEIVNVCYNSGLVHNAQNLSM